MKCHYIFYLLLRDAMIFFFQLSKENQINFWGKLRNYGVGWRNIKRKYSLKIWWLCQELWGSVKKDPKIAPIKTVPHDSPELAYLRKIKKGQIYAHKNEFDLRVTEPTFQMWMEMER